MKLGHIVAQALRRIADSLDKQASIAEERHTEVMGGIRSILGHVQPAMQRIENLEEDVKQLQKPAA